MNVKAIETTYNGYLFRSRLEARWAVFFDALGVKWEYEQQGYALGDMPYLPDFVLPELRLFVEVKPSGFLATGDAQAAMDKLDALSATIHPAMLVCGDPCDYRSHWFGQNYCESGGGLNHEEGGWSIDDPEHDEYAHFNLDCHGRPNVALDLMGNTSRVIHDADYEPISTYEYRNRDLDLVGKCAKAARAARFEFKGAWRQKRIARRNARNRTPVPIVGSLSTGVRPAGGVFDACENAEGTPSGRQSLLLDKGFDPFAEGDKP